MTEASASFRCNSMVSREEAEERSCLCDQNDGKGISGKSAGQAKVGRIKRSPRNRSNACGDDLLEFHSAMNDKKPMNQPQEALKSINVHEPVILLVDEPRRADGTRMCLPLKRVKLVKSKFFWGLLGDNVYRGG